MFFLVIEHYLWKLILCDVVAFEYAFNHKIMWKLFENFKEWMQMRAPNDARIAFHVGEGAFFFYRHVKNSDRDYLK